jgi:transposase InsO family protein
VPACPETASPGATPYQQPTAGVLPSLPPSKNTSMIEVLRRPIESATYTAEKFTALCRRLGIRQSMGRVGSCFDCAAAEAFFSGLEWEVLSRHEFDTTAQARATVIDWCYGFYNHQRRHSAAAGQSPINYETSALDREAA